MRTNLLAVRPTSAARAGTLRRAAAWLFGLVLTTVTFQGMPLIAEVLVVDDFNAPELTATNWYCSVLFGQGGCQVINDQARFSIKPDGEHGFVTLMSSSYYTLTEGRTLELRADLISSSGDGAMARLGFGQDQEIADRANYVLFFDQDTAAVVKRPETRQLLWLTNGPTVSATNVKMVMTLTGLPGGTMRVSTKVLDSSGVVLVDRSFQDAPAADPLGAGTDNPPSSLLGKSCRFMLGVYHDNADFLDPTPGIGPLEEAVVIFDKVEVLEYASSVAAIEKSVWISWLADTLEEQIVIGADSPLTNAVWTPWPEPIFRRLGQLCVAVPITTNQQFWDNGERYFKLTPGAQFIDDFNALKEPFATRNPWMPWFANSADSARFTFAITNGVLQIQTLAQPVDGQVMLYCPGNGAVVRDFYASVDILDWGSSTQESALGIGGRVQGDPNSWVSAMYLGSFRVNANGQAGKGGLYFFNGTDNVPPTRLFNLTAGSHYRLQFSVVGKQLTVRLLDLTKGGQVDQQETQSSVNALGRVALWLNTRGSTSYTRTVDNFFVTGTKP